MQNASLAAFLHLAGSPFSIALDASYYEWRQYIDHRGRPRSKVRAGRWSFATTLLDTGQYEYLLALMLNPAALVDARATYGRADGQGTFITVWGRNCSVCHVYSYFDSRGSQDRQPGWTLYFTLAAEEMGREAGTAGSFVMPEPGSYAYVASASSSKLTSPVDIIRILFDNSSLAEIREKISSGVLPRKHAELISIEEQSIIAFYTTADGYREFNLALRGEIPMTPFFSAQEKLLNNALSKLPKHIGPVVRGTGMSEILKYSEAIVGDSITYKNFVSSSMDEAIADDFMYRKKGDFVLRIQSKSGVQISDMSLAPAEDEILFPSNSKFRVVGKSFRPRFTEDDPLIREIYLEEL